MRIAVIGLGAIGSQTLLHLSQIEGVEATGYDRYNPGHGFGASGGENRVFSSVGTEYPNQNELIQYSCSVWSKLERLSERTIVSRVGYLAVHDEDKVEASHIVQAARKPSYGARILEREQLRAEFGFQSYREGDVGVFDPTGGIIRTDAAIFEAVRYAESIGAQVKRNTPVMAIEADDNRVKIRSGDEVQDFDFVVVATGPWAHQLLPELSQFVHLYRPTSAWFLPKEMKSVRGLPALVRDGEQQFYAVPTFDGASLKVGYGGPRQRRVVDGPNPQDTMVEPSELGEFPKILGEYLTGFDPNPFRIAHFFEGYTDSGRPIIQRTHDRIVVGVGFSGLGFKYSPVFGRLLAETVTDQETSSLLQPVQERIPTLKV